MLSNYKACLKINLTFIEVFQRGHRCHLIAKPDKSSKKTKQKQKTIQ